MATEIPFKFLGPCIDCGNPNGLYDICALCGTCDECEHAVDCPNHPDMLNCEDVLDADLF